MSAINKLSNIESLAEMLKDASDNCKMIVLGAAICTQMPNSFNAVKGLLKEKTIDFEYETTKTSLPPQAKELIDLAF